MTFAIIQACAVALVVILVMTVRRSLREPAPSPRASAPATIPAAAPVPVQVEATAPRARLPRLRVRHLRSRPAWSPAQPEPIAALPLRTIGRAPEPGNVVALRPDEDVERALRRLEAQAEVLRSEIAALRRAMPPSARAPEHPVRGRESS